MNNKNDDIGPSKGLKALTHKIAMFILYPLRKPRMFLIILIVFSLISAGLVGFPIYYGVKPAEIHKWYIEKYKSFDISNIRETVSPQVEEKGIDKLVELPEDVQLQPSRREGFGKATNNAPQAVDILAAHSGDVVSVDSIERPDDNTIFVSASAVDKNVVSDAPVQPKVNKTTDDYGYVSITKETPDTLLKYASEKKEIDGEAKVLNANELIVNDVYVFLHGIYSNPKNQRGVKAGVFLKSFLKDEKVRCEIIAYTEDNAATAECYVGDISINRMMVEKGYSDKVSLK